MSARTYIGYIAEQAGGFAVIGRDKKLYIKTFEQKNNVNLELFSEYKWGDKYKISKVVYEDGIQSYKFGTNADNTLFVDANNMYIVNSEQIENVYKSIKGLELYPFEGESIIDPASDIGDIILIDNKPVLYQGKLEYVGKFKADIKSQIEPKTQQESSQTKQSNTVKIKRVQSSIDQANAIIQQLVQETGQYDEKIAKVELDVDGLTTKVENIQDFVRNKEGYNQIQLDDIAEGEGYIQKFVIYGNSDNFDSKTIKLCVSKYPYNYEDLMNIQDENGNSIFDETMKKLIVLEGKYSLNEFTLQLDDVLRSYEKDGTIYYDTLEILQDGTINVVRKIGVDGSGELYLLDDEIITKLNEKLVLPSNKEYYYYIDKIYELKYYAEYIIDNAYANTFVPKVQFATQVEQNAEAVKIAWNQISQYIQMETLDNNAVMAIRDAGNKLLMALNKNGQAFYENNKKFGTLGVSTETVEEDGEEKINKYISFSIDTDYDKNINNGMAWGVTTTSDGEFHPLLYIKEFQTPPKNSGGATGELVLDGCNLVLGAENGHIIASGIEIIPEIIGGISFAKEGNGENLLSILKGSGDITYDKIQIFDNILFYKNQLDSNSFRLGNGDDHCLFTDDGHIYGKEIYVRGNSFIHGHSYFYDEVEVVSSSGTYALYINGNGYATGHIYADNISSDRNLKKNIKDSKTKAIDIINKIQHRQFDWKKDNKHIETGYIAQELEEIDENFVLKCEVKDKERYYVNILPVLATATKAIQEQQEQIEQLKKEIELLKGGK